MMGALAGALVAIRVHGPGPVVLVLALFGRGARRRALGRHRRAAALLARRRHRHQLAAARLRRRAAARVPLNNVWIIQEHGADSVRLAESDPISLARAPAAVRALPGLQRRTGFLARGRARVRRWRLLLTQPLGLPAPHPRAQPGCRAAAPASAPRCSAGAIVLSGAFAGLAGGVMLTGTAYRLSPTFANNVGWTGLLVALVAATTRRRDRHRVALRRADAGSFLSTAGSPPISVRSCRRSSCSESCSRPRCTPPVVIVSCAASLALGEALLPRSRSRVRGARSRRIIRRRSCRARCT